MRSTQSFEKTANTIGMRRTIPHKTTYFSFAICAALLANIDTAK